MDLLSEETVDFKTILSKLKQAETLIQEFQTSQEIEQSVDIKF